jgi:hypothetical protein
VLKRRPVEPIVPAASREEAGAIMAALERFERDTASRSPRAEAPANGWTRAAILEGLREQDEAPGQAGWRDPWINT